MAEPVHPSVHSVQAPTVDAPCYAAGVQSGFQELGDRDEAVLPPSNRRQRCI